LGEVIGTPADKNKAMKLKHLSNLLVLGMALTMTAVGCKTKKPGLTPLPGQGGSRLGNGANGNDLGTGTPVGNGGDINSHTPAITSEGIAPGGGHPGWQMDPSSPLQSQTLYFDYDKASVRTAEQSKLDAVADYMKSHGEVAVRVEGNCDERGTEEYNRALGERRALAAREYLVRLGVSADRVDTISYGEDKPADSGHNESAWSKNRRDEFQVLLPPKP